MKGDKVEWHETCYCGAPLRHERATVYDQFFSDIEIGPLVATTPSEGESFWHYLEDQNRENGRSHGDVAINISRYVPIRIY